MKYLLVVLASVCLLFGYLPYSFYSSKEKAESALKGALEANSSLESSLVKKEQECTITDEVITEWQKEKDASDKHKDSDIQKIDSIPKSRPISPKSGPVEAANNEIDIDSPLPESVKRVLDETFSRLSK